MMTPHDTDVLSSPDPDGPRDHRRRGLVAGLMTLALLAAGATGVALASDNPPSDNGIGNSSPDGAGLPVPLSANENQTPGGSASPQPKDRGDRPGRPFGHRGPGLRGPGLGGPMGALHGEFVVPKQGGGYQTLLVQRGTVSAVSSTSITVKSEDGFSQTYTVNPETVVNAGRDGIASIAEGAEVNVLARKTSGQPTALRIGDRSRWDGVGGHGPGHRDGDRGGTASPSPSSGATTQSSSFGV
jgi:Domain of unknown function (DUF5666)